MLRETDMNFGRKTSCANCHQHTVPQIGERIQHGGNEHITGYATDRVEMDMHA